MRIVTYRSERGDRAGVLQDGVVVDAADALERDPPPSVRDLLQANLLDELSDRVATAHEQGVPLENVTLLPPVPDPDKIVCMGINYRSHAAETGQELPD